MYGSYAKSLGDYAKEQAAVIRQTAKKEAAAENAEQSKQFKMFKISDNGWGRVILGRFVRGFAYVWSKTFAKVGEDWVFLALLGVIMALISFTMDFGIYMCNSGEFCDHCNIFKVAPFLF